jgi:ABC-type antimicrobial peptide transport system permease subunit
LSAGVIEATVPAGYTQIRDGFVRERLMPVLSGVFGLLAVVLAMLGLYGVISYVVSRRRNEIGIRMALGTQRQQVMGIFVQNAARWVAIGLCHGNVAVPGCHARCRLAAIRIEVLRPSHLFAAGVLLATVAALASFLPARRAAKLDPMIALRNE